MTSSEILTRIREITAPGNRVTTLNLGFNNIGDAGARALAQAIQSTHCSLTYLYLFGSDIGVDGARALAQAIQSTHCSLTSLNLNTNNIGDAGARALAQAIQSTHCSLTYLGLDRNDIGEDGARAVADALKHNRLVTTMDLRVNKISWALVSEINTHLQRNKKLRDDFLSKVKLAVGHDDHLAQVVAAMDEDITPSAHQRYALIQMIQSAGNKYLPQEQRAQHLAMIQWLLDQGVAVNGDVLREALETRQEDIIRRVKTAPVAVGVAAEAPMPPVPARRSLQAAAASATTPPVQPTETPVHIQADSPAAEDTAAISSSEQETVRLTAAGAEFVANMQLRSEQSGGLATVGQVSIIYIKGERHQSAMDAVVAARQAIASDAQQSELYEGMKFQMSSMMRAMQQANITYADAKTFSGENLKDQLLKYSAPLAEVSALGYVGLAVAETIYGKYRQAKFKTRCSKLVNLAGDGGQDVDLFAEALARRVVLDEGLMAKVQEVVTQEGKSSASLLSRAKSQFKPQKMTERVAANSLVDVAPVVLKLSALILECIFDNEVYDTKQTVDIQLVTSLQDQLHARLQVTPEAASAEYPAPTRPRPTEQRPVLPFASAIKARASHQASEAVSEGVSTGAGSAASTLSAAELGVSGQMVFKDLRRSIGHGKAGLKKVDLGKSYSEKLMRVIQSGEDIPIKQVESYIAQGADVNFKDDAGKTLLDYAVEINDLPLFQVLHGHGAQISAHTQIEQVLNTEMREALAVPTPDAGVTVGSQSASGARDEAAAEQQEVAHRPEKSQDAVIEMMNEIQKKQYEKQQAQDERIRQQEEEAKRLREKNAALEARLSAQTEQQDSTVQNTGPEPVVQNCGCTMM